MNIELEKCVLLYAMIYYIIFQSMLKFACILFACIVGGVLAACNTGLKNISLPDNGNVCDLLSDPITVVTVCAVSISSGLNAALAACSADTFIEITLSPTFAEVGPFIFPPVTGISITGTGTSVLYGGANIVEGNETALTFRDVAFDGQNTEEPLFSPQLRSNNLTLERVLMMHFHGKWGIAQEACSTKTHLQATDSYFFDNWGASLYVAGVRNYDIESNTFDACGGNQYGATFLKTFWGSEDVNIFYNNSQWVLFDAQPPICISYLDCGEHLRCNNGVFECEDLSATAIQDNCPQYNKTCIDPMTNLTVTELLYEPYCRNYAPCECESVLFRDVSNTTVSDFTLNVGDIIYPYTTLECQPGSTLVAGGGVGSVAPINFTDPSFENGNNPGPGLGWTTSPGNLILTNAVGVPKSRTGNRRVICEGGADSYFQQSVNFPVAGAYLVSLWGARRDNQRNNYDGGFLEIWINGNPTSSVIGAPTFYDTLVSDLVYYEFIFPPLNINVPGTKTFRIRCNFGATDNLQFAIDDIGSRASGLEIVSFPPGLGLGPPPLSEPIDYIALPLTSDAYINVLPCPACPPAPTRPPNLPCNYVIQSNFTCFATIYQTDTFCIEPDIFNLGTGAVIDGPSFENFSSWAIVTGTPLRFDNFPGTAPARTGNVIMWCSPFTIVAVRQTVFFPTTAKYILSFYGLRFNNPADYNGKSIFYTIDGNFAGEITNPQIAATTPFPYAYYLFTFDPVLISSGSHVLRFYIDMQGGIQPTYFQVDDLQFVGAFSSGTSTPTPSLSPTPSPIPTNITIPPSIYPSDQLRCVEEIVYLGDVPFPYGCIVPGDMNVTFMGNNVSANDCITVYSGSCSLPETYVFILGDTLIDCVSLSTGYMQCDCSTEKLLQEFVNRTITPGTCGFEFDHIDYNATLFINGNRAQQLDFGGCSRRVEFDTVVAGSTVITDFFDERGVGRELLKQNLLWGNIPDPSQPLGTRQGPRFLQDALPEYEAICEDNCPQANPTIPGSNIPTCIVDSAGADFDTSVYATVQDALDDPNCTKPLSMIDIRNSENPYEENLEFKTAYIHLFSSTNATIIGTHTAFGDLVVLFMRGIVWVHNGKNGIPLIDIDSANSLKNFTAWNNDFAGDSVKDGGVLHNFKRTLEIVDFRYNRVRDYQTTSVRVTANALLVAHNTWEDCSGRLFQGRYTDFVTVESNVFINSRGASDFKNPALFEFQFVGRRDSTPCDASPSACAIRRNTQLMTVENPETATDYNEIGILLRRGAFFVESIRDNLILKAKTGLRLRLVTSIASPEALAQVGSSQILQIYQFYNPLVRPSRTRAKKDGDDFVIDGFFDGSRFSAVRCSFPDCTPFDLQPKRCVANLNFETFYSNQYGWETFNNASQASFYCPLDTVNVTVFGGARIIPEKLAIRRPLSNDLQRPLVDAPTYLDILLGDAPVPNRFTLQGVEVHDSDLEFYSSLLDANQTYGFGDSESVYVHTNFVCKCPAINAFTGQPLLYESVNCTELFGPNQSPDLCADAIAADPTIVACQVADESTVNCVQDGVDLVGNILVVLYSCTIDLYVTKNNTVIVGNTTTYVLVNMTIQSQAEQFVPGDLEQCYFEEVPVYIVVFTDDTLNTCITPAYYSVGGNFLSLNMTWRDLEFILHFASSYNASSLNVPMLENVDPSMDLRFERVVFDGDGVVAPTRMTGLKLQMGLAVSDQLGRKQSNYRPAVPSTLFVLNCSFQNFLFFETILNNSVGSVEEEAEIHAFPYIDAFDVEYVNRLGFDPTVFVMDRCNFTDIDRTAVRTRFANQTIFSNNLGVRCGGRSLDTPATYWFEGNSASVNTRIELLNNNLTQTRDVTYPFLGDLTVPAYQSLVWATGLRDQAYYDCLSVPTATIDQCIQSIYPTCCPTIVDIGNFWCGLPIGLRLVGDTAPLSQYIMDSMPVAALANLGDNLTPLRSIALANNVSIDGTWCDIVLGAPNLDWYKENLCCNEACPPKPPPACRVNSSDTTINPLNPWFDIYLFDDINRAMELCQTIPRKINLEMPLTSDPYEVRLTASVAQPPVIQYTATWNGPVTISVLSTFPTSGLSSPGGVSIPIDWTDTTLPPISVIVIPSLPSVLTTSIEVTGSLQMPQDVPEGVPTDTPGGWPMQISIKYTFCVPSNTIPPIASFPVSFIYTSPPINVNTPSFDYAATLVVSWDWTGVSATISTNTGTVLNGVGLPYLQCNGHTPNGSNITVQNIDMIHADPCIDLSLDPITCPCTTIGLATWHQMDSAPAPDLLLQDNNWDGAGYSSLAIDGEFWGKFVTKRNTFSGYSTANPGYVVRAFPSPTEDCCAQACENDFRSMHNVFIGVNGVFMTGNVVRLGPAERISIDHNTGIDVGAQDVVHGEAAIFYAQNCPGLPLKGSMSYNSVERTAGSTIQTRVPPNDCYWTVYEIDELSLSAGQFDVLYNVQTLPSPTMGAPICLRPINWPVTSPSSDCQFAVRSLVVYNPQCDGTLEDVFIAPCSKDVCLARILGCQPSDTDCLAATVPPCSQDDDCLFCSGTCGRPIFDPPVWFIIASAVLVLVLLGFIFCCCGCLFYLCIMAMPMKIGVRGRRHRPMPAISTLNEKEAMRLLVKST